MIPVKGDRFLVTGGAGFIGSHIIEELLKQHKEVICLDNFFTGKEDNIFDFRSNSKFRLVTADITNLESIVRHFSGVDVVFHQAASKCTVCREDPGRDLLVNAQGAWNVFEAARLAKVRKVVHASTGSVYGEALGPQTEEHGNKPVSFYGVSKLAGEKYLEPFRQYYGLRYSVIRYFHVFGARQDGSDTGGVIPIFIRKALSDEPITIFGNGKQVRHFTYVKDDVAANFILANTTKTDSESYNVANSAKLTIRELAEMIISLTKSYSKIVHKPWRKGDIRWFDVKSDKIERMGLNFTPFDGALRNTIQWYKERGCGQ